MRAGLVIFDCDGVLVDSDRIALRILTQRLGRPLPEGWGAGLEAAVEAAFRRELRPVAGIVEAIDAIDLPTCVASGGSQEKMRLTLGLTGLRDRFAGRIFSADEVERGKPAPDLFLHAAARTGVEPERCVVVEDSPFGVAGDRLAG